MIQMRNPEVLLLLSPNLSSGHELGRPPNSCSCGNLKMVYAVFYPCRCTTDRECMHNTHIAPPGLFFHHHPLALHKPTLRMTFARIVLRPPWRPHMDRTVVARIATRRYLNHHSLPISYLRPSFVNVLWLRNQRPEVG